MFVFSAVSGILPCLYLCCSPIFHSTACVLRASTCIVSRAFNGVVAAALFVCNQYCIWLRCVRVCLFYAVHRVRRARFRGISPTQPDPQPSKNLSQKLLCFRGPFMTAPTPFGTNYLELVKYFYTSKKRLSRIHDFHACHACALNTCRHIMA